MNPAIVFMASTVASHSCTLHLYSTHRNWLLFIGSCWKEHL